MTRDEIVRLIGSIIDHPSVYTGGASRQSMRKAERILEALAASGYAVVKTGQPMRLDFVSENGTTTIELDADAWSHVVAAAQEDSHE